MNNPYVELKSILCLDTPLCRTLTCAEWRRRQLAMFSLEKVLSIFFWKNWRQLGLVPLWPARAYQVRMAPLEGPLV
jgi:hypothetical protein